MAKTSLIIIYLKAQVVLITVRIALKSMLYPARKKEGLYRRGVWYCESDHTAGLFNQSNLVSFFFLTNQINLKTVSNITDPMVKLYVPHTQTCMRDAARR